MSSPLRRLRSNLGTVAELVRSLWNGPHWWLVIVMAVLLPTALLLIVLQIFPGVAPFAYTLF